MSRVEVKTVAELKSAVQARSDKIVLPPSFKTGLNQATLPPYDFIENECGAWMCRDVRHPGHMPRTDGIYKDLCRLVLGGAHVTFVVDPKQYECVRLCEYFLSWLFHVNLESNPHPQGTPLGPEYVLGNLEDSQVLPVPCVAGYAEGVNLRDCDGNAASDAIVWTRRWHAELRYPGDIAEDDRIWSRKSAYSAPYDTMLTRSEADFPGQGHDVLAVDRFNHVVAFRYSIGKGQVEVAYPGYAPPAAKPQPPPGGGRGADKAPHGDNEGTPPEPATTVEFKVSVVFFPTTCKNQKRDKATLAGKKYPTTQCVLRFLAIHYASQGDGSFLFSDDGVKMTPDGENVVDLPGAGAFSKTHRKGRGKTATGLATQVDRIIYRMLTGKREPDDKQGRKEMKEILNRVLGDERRISIGGMLPVKLRKVKVSVSEKAKANIKAYCKKIMNIPESEIDKILGACTDR